MSGEQYLYLTTLGRKTGLPREIEIGFVSFDNKYWDWLKSQWLTEDLDVFC